MEEKKWEEKKPDQNKKLKIFISYSHQDNTPQKPNITAFEKHLAPLISNGLIELWYDRSIVAGDDFSKRIDCNLEDADIICLFISVDFLFSKPCMNEKRKALELKRKKGVPVIPIILSLCEWKDDLDLTKMWAIPSDGKPVSEFPNQDAAWQDVYRKLKEIIQKEQKNRQLRITEQFNQFLHDAEIFTKAHPKKETISLTDIYIDTDLRKFDSEKKYSVTINSNELIDTLFIEKKIIIAGEEQSGKTTLCKRIFCELRRLNFIPVYVSVSKTSHSGNIDNIISKSLHEQYVDIDEKEIDAEKIIPIIDDFHSAKDKGKHIKNLVKYSFCVVVVDDIFSFNIKDEVILSSFISLRIKELKPSMRSELIKKWISLSDKGFESDYRDLDKKVELIDSTLGRNIGKGLMPAYPFFILSTLFTYDTFLPLNQDITSQGHCYEAFVYYYLTQKRGVKFDQIDIYLNFLSEFASYMHQERRNELSNHEFSIFLEKYTKKYNLPIKPEILLNNLHEIVSLDSFNNYSFRYSCFYYYFIAKGLSEHIEEPEGIERIKKILHNLHKDENAYIAIFLIHHSKNTNIFKEIERVSSSLFHEYTPATLVKEEMNFFDEQLHNIVKALLPPDNVTTEMARTEKLKMEDKEEQSKEDNPKEDRVDEKNKSATDFRKAIKTVEVMGCIIRNRSGSLEREKLQTIFLNGMNVHLRMLTSLIDTIREEDKQTEIVDFISKRLSHLDEKKDPTQRLSEEKRRKLARNIFWNLNFFAVYGIIYKIVHSLGSDNLTDISNHVCDEVDNPAAFLIKQGILMGYEKNLQIDGIHKRINDDDFSKIAKRTAEIMVVDFCSLNPVKYRDKQRIESTLKIPRFQLK